MTKADLRNKVPGVYLADQEDFEWHKAELDVKDKYRHRHTGAPKEYPCSVSSGWRDDPNGPYTYDHSFRYPEVRKAVCESCGHENEDWGWSEMK